MKKRTGFSLTNNEDGEEYVPATEDDVQLNKDQGYRRAHMRKKLIGLLISAALFCTILPLALATDVEITRCKLSEGTQRKSHYPF